MCKSENEKGGPYRCPGDMQRNLDSAQNAYGKAVEGVSQAEVEAENAQITLESEQEDSAQERMKERLTDQADDCDGTYEDADRISNEVAGKGWVSAVEQTQTFNPENDYEGERQYDSEQYEVKVFESQAELDEYMEDRFETSDGEVAYGLDQNTVDYATGETEEQALFIKQPQGEQQIDSDISKEATQRIGKAEKNLASAQAKQAQAKQKVSDARQKVREAQKDYDATPRGIGELNAQAEQARASGDEVTADDLESRVATAEKRVNEEESVRRDVAAQQGVDRDYYNYQAMGAQESSEEFENSSAVVKDAGVSGVSRVYEPGTNQNWTDATRHNVTMTRVDEDGKRQNLSANYYMGSHHDGNTPSCSEVLGTMGDDAASVENSGGDFEEWHHSMGGQDKFEDPEGYRESKRTFKEIQQNSERAERFLGSDNWEKIKFPDN